MSALANTSSTTAIAQNLLAKKARLVDSISDISVTTRIDYNLRFTKQAVLVVAEHTEQYSQLASQFLVTLSSEQPNSKQNTSQDNHINVAFVSASTKLNDIQIRCRLIEQLFVNNLFDPEESLAVSALRFAKQQSEPISIVIDHAQALSLQIKYELSQLVNLAKKNKLTINVVLFGLTEAAQQLSENKTLFKSKVVLIDAESGQVLSLDDKKIALEKKTHSLGLWQKLTLIGAMSIITGALIWLYLLIVDDVNQQTNISKAQATQVINTAQSPNNETKIVNDISTRQMLKKEKIDQIVASPMVSTTKEYKQASSGDVLKALLVDSRAAQEVAVPAQAEDVLQALVTADIHNKNETKALISGTKTPTHQLDESGNIQQSRDGADLNYYQTNAKEHKQGYIIQIAGFSDPKLWKRFIKHHDAESFYSYRRLLANNEFTVVTSKVYFNKAEAKAAISQLSPQLLERKPWLKPISSVINEINTFTR